MEYPNKPKTGEVVSGETITICESATYADILSAVNKIKASNSSLTDEDITISSSYSAQTELSYLEITSDRYVANPNYEQELEQYNKDLEAWKDHVKQRKLELKQKALKEELVANAKKLAKEQSHVNRAMRRLQNPKRCRYNDCVEQNPIAAKNESITCETCRKELGL